MINEERVKLMTRMAAYEQGEFRKHKPVVGFFRSDYISLQLVKAMISTTLAYAILVGLYIMYDFEVFMKDIYQMDLFQVIKTAIIFYLVMLGVFFSMENPSAVFRQQAVLDLFTGLQSRNSFEVRFQRMEEHYRTRKLPEGHYGFVYCDVNDLKYVNDNLGHQTGDEYLTMIAGTLMKKLRSAQAHYRIGGDEFLSVYKDTAEEKIRAAKEFLMGGG